MEEERPPVKQTIKVNTAYQDDEVVSSRMYEEKPEREKNLWLNVSVLDEEDLEELLDTLTFYEGETTVYFVKNGKKMLCTQKVNVNKALLAELSTFLPQDYIKFI